MMDLVDAISILHNKNRGRVDVDKINAWCFCCVMIFLCMVTHLAPADGRVEELENRALTALPELSLRTALSGEFSSRVEGYIADRVGFRTDFVLMSQSIGSAYGVAMREAPTVIFSSNPANRAGHVSEPADLGPGNSAGGAPGSGVGGAQNSGSDPGGGSGAAYAASDYARTRPDSVSLSAAGQGGASLSAVAAGGAEPVRAGPLLAFPDRLIELFGYSESACIRYAEIVSGYAGALEGRGRVFSLIVPTAIEFIDDRYKSASDSEYAAIRAVNDNLENVRSVDAYSYLGAHREEYVYFRTDHHWTALGAYYAYLAFCEAAGLVPVPIGEYDSYELAGFWGYLYNVHPTSELRDNPDTIIYYRQRESVEVSSPLHVVYGNATYSIFIGGDNPIYEITTSVGNGRTCAVIKDSFGNAFVPWLAPNYERIIVFDPRSFNGSVLETLAGYDDIDLIVLNSVFSVGSGGFNGLINGIR